MDTFLSFRFLIPAGVLLFPFAVLAYMVLSTAMQPHDAED
jgi:hypothetical protein